MDARERDNGSGRDKQGGKTKQKKALGPWLVKFKRQIMVSLFKVIYAVYSKV